MIIGVISALEGEHNELARRISQAEEIRLEHLTVVRGHLEGNTLLLVMSGIAKVNAAITATLLIREFHPDCIISTGVAGGIDPSVAIADVVASTRVAHHDVWCGEGQESGQVQGLPMFFESSGPLLARALELNREDLPCKVHPGEILTGEQFIQKDAQLLQIKASFPGGKAVDMESAALAQACHLMGVPFISFRIISDLPGSVPDNFRQYADFWGTLRERSFDITWRYLKRLSNLVL